MWNEGEINYFSKRAEAQKLERKGGEDDRGSDGKTAIREIWREWNEIGEQQQTTGVDDFDVLSYSVQGAPRHDIIVAQIVAQGTKMFMF